MSVAAAKAIAVKFESRRLRMYARAKVAADPVYAAALEQLRGSALPLLDIGCGIGLLAFYLRESGLDNPIIGIDTDEEKIRAGAAVAAGHYRDVKLLCGDARDPAAFSGNVALLDVVHYLTDSEQRELLAAAADSVAPGGVLIIRDCIRDGSWRYALTFMEEWFAKTIGWLRVPRLNFPRREVLTAELERRGFQTSVSPLWGRTPYNNYLVVSSRPKIS